MTKFVLEDFVFLCIVISPSPTAWLLLLVFSIEDLTIYCRPRATFDVEDGGTLNIEAF